MTESPDLPFSLHLAAGSRVLVYQCFCIRKIYPFETLSTIQDYFGTVLRSRKHKRPTMDHTLSPSAVVRPYHRYPTHRPPECFVRILQMANGRKGWHACRACSPRGSAGGRSCTGSVPPPGPPSRPRSARSPTRAPTRTASWARSPRRLPRSPPLRHPGRTAGSGSRSEPRQEECKAILLYDVVDTCCSMVRCTLQQLCWPFLAPGPCLVLRSPARNMPQGACISKSFPRCPFLAATFLTSQSPGWWACTAP